jgi:hypothetical protein
MCKNYKFREEAVWDILTDQTVVTVTAMILLEHNSDFSLQQPQCFYSWSVAMLATTLQARIESQQAGVGGWGGGSVEKHYSILHQKLQGNVGQELVQFQLCANTVTLAVAMWRQEVQPEQHHSNWGKWINKLSLSMYVATSTKQLLWSWIIHIEMVDERPTWNWKHQWGLSLHQYQ